MHVYALVLRRTLGQVRIESIGERKKQRNRQQEPMVDSRRGGRQYCNKADEQAGDGPDPAQHEEPAQACREFLFAQRTIIGIMVTAVEREGLYESLHRPTPPLPEGDLHTGLNRSAAGSAMLRSLSDNNESTESARASSKSAKRSCILTLKPRRGVRSKG